MEEPRSPELSHDTSAQRRNVVEAATPALEEWGYGTGLSAVRRRLRGLLGASLVVIAIQLLLNPGGITGFLISVWFLLSLPVAAVAGCLLVLLKDPTNAADVWWEDGTMAAAGLVSLAGLAKVGQAGPAGRALWQLLFGSDPPVQSDYRFETDESEVDLAAAARIRRYVWYAIVGSATVMIAEQVARRGALQSTVFEPLVGANPGPAGWTLLVVGAGVLGVVLGLVAAVTEL